MSRKKAGWQQPHYPVEVPWVKNLTIQINSIYNGWRFEDIWLDR